MALTYKIPFNKPAMAGKELDYVVEAFQAGHVSGDGMFTKKCHDLLEKALGVPKALLTTSCTHALEMAAILLDIQPGDEVILPTFTFVSMANAFALRGARLVFADIRPDTLNIDERELEKHITAKTKAIVVVHYAGVGCEMDLIMKIAGRHGVPVVEDNAHGLFGRYRGGHLGTFGCLATLSFHETKNFSCGEGGALLINDPRFIERAEIIREKGTNRARFFRGQVDKYTWVDLGSSYLPSDILAAVLYAQLEARDSIQGARRAIWQNYYTHLSAWAAKNGIRLPVVPEHCEQPHHMFYLLMPAESDRQSLIEHLRSRGILSVFHYQPLHLSEMGRSMGGKTGQCPMAEEQSQRLLRLPLFHGMTADDQQHVIEVCRQFSVKKIVQVGGMK